MHPTASDAVQQVFGLALRRLRTQAGLSLRALGQASHYDHSRLSRIENGEHLVEAARVPALDEAVGGEGLLVTLRALIPDQVASGAKPGVESTKSLSAATQRLDAGDSVVMDVRTPEGNVIRVSVSRREFAQLVAAGVLNGSFPGGVPNPDRAAHLARAMGERRSVDPEALAYFRTMLAEHFTADRMLGPPRLLGSVCAQLDVLDGLRRHARPGTTEPLLRLMAQYAEFAGWLCQDLGDIAAAMSFSDRASQWAQAVGDYQMVAYLLVRKSNIALLDGDAVSVVDLASAAEKVPGPLSPKLVALALQQQARGWALLGTTDQFRVGLDRAADLLDTHPDDVGDDAPVYLHRYDVDVLEEQSASCYRACGQADKAITILERRIADTPEHLRRDRGHQIAKLANTVLAAPVPDPDRAAALGMQCVQVARDMGSVRIDRELRALNTSLRRRWPRRPGTIHFHEALRTPSAGRQTWDAT